MVIVLVVAAPAAYLVRRFRRGDELVPGGSHGFQMSRSKKETWGPR